MPKIKIFPQNIELDVDEGASLLSSLRKNGLYIKSSCGGVASCSDCIIKVCEGEEFLSAPPFEELSLLGNVFHLTKERLSCQTKISGPVTIDISAHDQAKDQDRLLQKTKHVKRTILKKDFRAQSDQENENTEEKPLKKKMGGGRRPRPFKISKEDNES